MKRYRIEATEDQLGFIRWHRIREDPNGEWVKFNDVSTEKPCRLSPTPPPTRIFSGGFTETKESKQAMRDWENYIRGYCEGLKAARVG